VTIMKKQGILNSHISEVLSRLGHTDTIVIADCGLPIPDETIRIDLSLKPGNPGFIETLEAILEDMVVEKVTFAEEIINQNPSIKEKTVSLIEGAAVEYVTHEQFKEQSKQAKAVIRTGETTPYANIILHSGVIF
jgi:D-ribose pyranase